MLFFSSLTDNMRQVNTTLSLAEYFFKPSVIETDEVFDGLLRGMTTQTSQKMDINIISDVSTVLTLSIHSSRKLHIIQQYFN